MATVRTYAQTHAAMQHATPRHAINLGWWYVGRRCPHKQVMSTWPAVAGIYAQPPQVMSTWPEVAGTHLKMVKIV